MGDLAARQYELYSAHAGERWHDLSTNRPGDGLRARIAAERLALRRGRSWSAARQEAEHRWQLGIEGEKLVGFRLDRLEAVGWRVLHSVPVGDLTADIDHVLIGPGGVFTVNTKHRRKKSAHLWRDHLEVGERDHDEVAKSLHEGVRATRFLTGAVGSEVLVEPVLVFHGLSSLNVHQPVEGVLVLEESFAVPSAFRTRRPVLDQSAVEAIFDVARRSPPGTDRDRRSVLAGCRVSQ